MLSKTIKSMRRRVGPVGLSLVAAALTAVAFAAVSVAQDDDSKKEDGDGGDVLREGHPGPGGPGVMFFHERLSDEDRKAMDEFRQCMEDNGAPAPPEPPNPEEIKPGERPERLDPPSEAERESIEKALDACEGKLPEGLPHPGPGGPCGPPPGAEGEGAVLPAPSPGSESRSG